MVDIGAERHIIFHIRSLGAMYIQNSAQSPSDFPSFLFNFDRAMRCQPKAQPRHRNRNGTVNSNVDCRLSTSRRQLFCGPEKFLRNRKTFDAVRCTFSLTLAMVIEFFQISLLSILFIFLSVLSERISFFIWIYENIFLICLSHLFILISDFSVLSLIF